MRINQKHIQYILLLLIVVIAVCAYQFGYVKYIEKANSVKNENKDIETRINTLNEKEAHRQEWSDGIVQSDAEIRKILAKYGPGNTPEKSIMFIKSLEEAAGMKIPNISFAQDSTMFVSSDTDENGKPKVELDTSYLTINYQTTYDGLKACMNYINNYPERMNVNNFSAGYDKETGLLTGSMVINLFGVKDADHIYEDPYIGGIELGLDNIFGTMDVDLNSLINGPENNTPANPDETNPTGE